MVRFLHTADWQLGMTRHFLRGEAQGRFAQDRVDVLVRMADLARDRDVDFAVVAGDVFDTTTPDRRTVDRAADALRSFSVPVFLLPGNHDALVPGSVFRAPSLRSRLPDVVDVLDDDEPRRVGEHVEVIGAPWRSKRPIADPVTPACHGAPDDSRRRIVVGHGAVDAVSGDFDAPGTIRLADLEAAVAAGGIDYVALGDRHSTTCVGESGRIWYAGAPEPTAYREVDAGKALIVELAADPHDPPHVEAVEVGRWRFLAQQWELASDDDIARRFADLDALEDKARRVISIATRGVVTLRQAAALADGIEARAEAFGALEHPDRHQDLTVLVDGDELRDRPLPTFVAEARDRLVAAASGHGETAETARDALGLLVRFVTENDA